MPQIYEFNWVFIYCDMWIFSGTILFPLLKLVFLQFKEHLLNNCIFQLCLHTSLVMVVFILIDKERHILRVSDLLEATCLLILNSDLFHHLAKYGYLICLIVDLFWGVLFLATE